MFSFIRMTVISFTALITLVSSQSYADENTCPSKIGYLATNPLAEKVLENIKYIYNSLGCETNFFGYPGNRAIRLFNVGELDGDLLRGKIVESNFTTDFIRSEKPIYKSEKVVWAAPNITENKPTGFLKGVKWQEEIANSEKKENKRYVGFASYPKMINAYNRGAIDQFLFLKPPNQIQSTPVFTRTPPIVSYVIDEIALYHYLSSEHKEFMRLFNQANRGEPHG